MIGKRTRASLAQFMELYEPQLVVLLLNKYEIRVAIEEGRLLSDTLQSLRAGADESILSLLGELVRTDGDLRARITPKYRFNERYADLVACLNLDGYVVDNGRVVPIDPSIDDAPPVEDDLLGALRGSGLSGWEAIARKINESSVAFRSSPPNYNASLNDVRIALETLARAIATVRSTGTPQFDPSKWGSVISYLRQVGFLTLEEEKGLAGVYGFVSPGSHRPVGVPEEQMARLGRSLSLGMCWFLVKNHETSP